MGRHFRWAVLALVAPGWVGAQDLPVDVAPATAGIVVGEPISAEAMQQRFLTLINAINDLHGEVETLRDALAERDERLAAVEGPTQGTRNLAFHYDVGQGRFSIHCLPARGPTSVPCSEENPGYVVMPSLRHGGLVSLRVASDVHFFHDNRRRLSDLIGNSFNTEPGRAWPSVRPFFIYAVNGDDTEAGLRFAVSLHPAAVRVPSFGGEDALGRRGLPATANEPIDFVLLSDGDRGGLAAQYQVPARPVLAIGSIEMSKVVEPGRPDDWLMENAGPGAGAHDAAGLATGTDWDVGLGRFPWHRDYALPVGAARGTAEGSFFRPEGGAITCVQAEDAHNLVRYRVRPDGLVRTFVYLGNCSGNARNFLFVPPYVGGATWVANDELNFTVGLSGVVIDRDRPDGGAPAFSAPLTSTFNGSAFYSLFFYPDGDADPPVPDGIFQSLPLNATVNLHIETVYRVFPR